MTRSDIKALFETGDIPTGDDFATFIDSAVNEVSEVSTWTSPVGTSVSWLNWGKMYSFWSHGQTIAPFNLTNEWMQWATVSDIPPLSAYVGEPMDELLMVEIEGDLLPIGYLEVSTLGFRIRGVSAEMEIAAGSKFIANKMLILDYGGG